MLAYKYEERTDISYHKTIIYLAIYKITLIKVYDNIDLELNGVDCDITIDLPPKMTINEAQTMVGWLSATNQTYDKKQILELAKDFILPKKSNKKSEAQDGR